MYAATDIEKHYGGVTALRGVDLEVLPGEVHALVGANGAGKSTLVKILAGSERPSAGRILLDGDEVHFAHQRQAVEQGVAIVSQELNLFPDLSVLHNLFLPAEPRRGPVVAWGQMRARARPVCEEIGLLVDLDRPLGSLRLGERQLVEIARALLRDPKILILDEPTSALETEESRRLLDVVGRLRERDVGIIFVTHFLEDVFALADRITVVRDGRVMVAGAARDSMSMSDVVREMLGDLPEHDEAARGSERHEVRPGGVTLREVTVPGHLVDASLEARCGEIVGLAGLEGSGARRVFDVLFGLSTPVSGRVELPGGAARPTSPAEAVRAGVAFVPADRKALGVMLAKPLYENVTQVSGSVLGRLGPLLRRGEMQERARRWSSALGVKVPGPDTLVGQLSGGNQQKVVFAKWLDAEPEVYLLDDPTRGVDIGAKEEMHTIIRSLAAEGRVVLVASSELEELVKVCDRVIVFFQGRVAGELTGPPLQEHRLLEAINTGRL